MCSALGGSQRVGRELGASLCAVVSWDDSPSFCCGFVLSVLVVFKPVRLCVSGSGLVHAAQAGACPHAKCREPL